MRQMFYRVVPMLLLFAGVVFSQKYSSVLNSVKKYQQTKLLKNASWSVTARYLDTGEKIIEYNSNLSLAPASNMKLLTTSAALEILGEEHRFVTRLFYDGRIDAKGILHGNIYIVGGGDPTLGYNLVNGSLSLDDLMTRWVNALIDKGIKRIDGDIIADDLLYDKIPIPDNWYWVDLGNYYAASTSALTIHNNLYFLFFKPAKKVGDKAKLLRIVPEIPGISFLNYMQTGKSGSGDNGYVYAAPGQYNAVLRGTIPQGKSEFYIKGAIPNPPLFAAQYFCKAIRLSGISVTGKANVIADTIKYDKRKKIDQLYSPQLKDIVYIINKKSDNLYTEMLLRAIGLKEFNTGSIEAGIDAVKNFFDENGINHDGLIMYDGCGLSRSDAITTNLMVDILTEMTKKKSFKTFYNSLGIVGEPTDISHFNNMGIGTAIEKNARIKSGVIGGVRAYSGYLNDRAGRIIVFSMIANNFNGEGVDVSNIHKKIMIKLAELK